MTPHPILSLRDAYNMPILDGPDSELSISVSTSHPNTANTALVSAGASSVAVEGSVELNGLKIGDGNDELGYMAGNSLVYTGDSIRMIL